MQIILLISDFLHMTNANYTSERNCSTFSQLSWGNSLFCASLAGVDSRSDIAHTVEFLHKMSNLKIRGAHGYVGTSNILWNSLSYSLHFCKNLAALWVIIIFLLHKLTSFMHRWPIVMRQCLAEPQVYEKQQNVLWLIIHFRNYQFVDLKFTTFIFL